MSPGRGLGSPETLDDLSDDADVAAARERAGGVGTSASALTPATLVEKLVAKYAELAGVSALAAQQKVLELCKGCACDG